MDAGELVECNTCGIQVRWGLNAETGKKELPSGWTTEPNTASGVTHFCFAEHERVYKATRDWKVSAAESLKMLNELGYTPKAPDEEDIEKPLAKPIKTREKSKNGRRRPASKRRASSTDK